MGPNWIQAEGFILGVGAKMFTIAGPVIVYGISASVVYGLIYWICQMLKQKACQAASLLLCRHYFFVQVCDLTSALTGKMEKFFCRKLFIYQIYLSGRFGPFLEFKIQGVLFG